MARARDNVLSTYELLEAILHALPTKDLLLSQRVCRDWRKVTKRSQKLQQALFLVPAGPEHAGPEDQHPLKFIRDWRCNSQKWAHGDDGLNMKVYGNPLLVPIYAAMENIAPAPFKNRLLPPWQRADGSWRKMLLTQPPTAVELWAGAGCIRFTYGTVTRAEDILDPSPDFNYWGHEYGMTPSGVDEWLKLENNKQLEELSTDPEGEQPKKRCITAKKWCITAKMQENEEAAKSEFWAELQAEMEAEMQATTQQQNT